MKNYFFTCGQSHKHIIDNAVWDKDSVLQVKAKDEITARQKVISLVGQKWSSCYDDESIEMEYWPKGICKSITA